MSSFLAAALAVASLAPAVASSASNASSAVVTDRNVIQRYWGQLSPYADNAESYFGVEDVGLPDGCGIEQAHTLQRHAQRFATSAVSGRALPRAAPIRRCLGGSGCVQTVLRA